MVNKKDRRHHGRRFPRKSETSFIHGFYLYVFDYWDDWGEYRDGCRDWFKDGKKIKQIRNIPDWEEQVIERKLRNTKQKRLLKRRKVRKVMKKLTNK